MARNNGTLRLGPLSFAGLSTGTVVAGVFLAAPLLLALYVGLVMVMFGVVHSFWEFIPAFSFWQTAGVLILVRLLTGNSSSNKD